MIQEEVDILRDIGDMSRASERRNIDDLRRLRIVVRHGLHSILDAGWLKQCNTG